MTTDAENRSTWPRDGQVIRRAELLRLIEENGSPQDLDLRGVVFVGDEPIDDPVWNPIDLSAEALAPSAEAYRQADGGNDPPWFRSGLGTMFMGAQLQGANLHRAQLDESDLTLANCEGANLSHASLQGSYLEVTCLLKANLRWADLQKADLGGADLQAAELVGANFQGADLAGVAFRQANLEEADLRGATVEEADFQQCNLYGCHLELLDMYDVVSLQGVSWYAARLDHTRIRREALGGHVAEEPAGEVRDREERSWAHHEAKEAYLLLKNNFNQIGRYEDSSWAYVKEQQMEKMAFHWEWRSHRWKVWRGWGSFSRWLRNWAYELLTGYGERPWNAVGAGVAAILAFGVGFWASGIGGGRSALAFLDCLVYSIATFATFNLARSDLNPQGRGIEIASSLEAILGISVLALVVFTVGNRMSRG